MKMTMPEGLGLLGAVAVGGLLILGSHGTLTRPVKAEPDAAGPVLDRSVDVDVEVMPGNAPQNLSDLDVPARRVKGGQRKLRRSAGASPRINGPADRPAR